MAAIIIFNCMVAKTYLQVRASVFATGRGLSGGRSRHRALDPSDLFFFFIFIYSKREREREREREADTGRGRSRLHAGSLTWDSISGLQDHTQGQRQALNH